MVYVYSTRAFRLDISFEKAMEQQGTRLASREREGPGSKTPNQGLSLDSLCHHDAVAPPPRWAASEYLKGQRRKKRKLIK